MTINFTFNMVVKRLIYIYIFSYFVCIWQVVEVNEIGSIKESRLNMFL